MKQEVQKRIPIPTNYRNAAKYVRLAIEEKKDVTALIEQDRHFRCGRTLVGRVLSNWQSIDALYRDLDLATKEPKTSPWIAKVMISELVYGSGRLVGNSATVQRMITYEEMLRDALSRLLENMPAAGRVKAPRYVRINTSLIEPEVAMRMLAEENFVLVSEQFTDYRAFIERVQRLDGLEFMVDFHFPEMLVFAPTTKKWWARADHLKPMFLLQDKACLLPTYLLKPRKKSVVLDMCAAPGNKTTHLACMMKNKGRIYAVERNAERYTALCENVQKFGVIKTIKDDCLNITDEQAPGVEFVLVDPSCSGSGMWKRQMVEEPVDPARLRKLSGLQYKLLSHAINAFPCARRVVYSTCSLHEEENEQVVQGVLRHNKHFRLLDARAELGMEGFSVGSDTYPDVGPKCLYTKSVDDLTIGMFVAVLERCPEGVENKICVEYEKQKESYDRFAQKKRRYGMEENGKESGAVEERKPKWARDQAVEDDHAEEVCEETVAKEENLIKKRKKKERPYSSAL